MLVSDTGFGTDGIVDRLWIGFDSKEAMQRFLDNMNRSPERRAIVQGVLVTDQKPGLGFRFDRSTTDVAPEVMIPEEYVFLDTIKAFLSQFLSPQPAGFPPTVTVERVVRH